MTERIGGGIGILEIEQSQSDLDIELLLRRLLIASERAVSIFEKDFEICFYNEELEAMVDREIDIVESLNAIVADDDRDNDLFLQYQPIMDLRTGSIYAFEALSRLRTGKLGLVSPLEFIPIAEKTKLILPIGEKVIAKAFSFLNRLKGLGYDEICISINISVIQLLSPDFIERLFELMSWMQVNSRNICIEITESVFASDYDGINYILEKLKEAGVSYSYRDDFGTGYSSFARERGLKVDCMKIDKYFIDKLSCIDLSKAITGDIISIAHKLGHSTIAEGVEHERQAAVFKGAQL